MSNMVGLRSAMSDSNQWRGRNAANGLPLCFRVTCATVRPWPHPEGHTRVLLGICELGDLRGH